MIFAPSGRDFNMKSYTPFYVKQVFALIPEAKWLAVDEDGYCAWYSDGGDEPESIHHNMWSIGSRHYLGHVKFTGDWKKTLRGRG